jgi:hypothetical protein
MRARLADTFWVLVLAFVVLFAFFAILGAFSPGDVIVLTLVGDPDAGLDHPRRLGLAAPRPARSRHRPGA